MAVFVLALFITGTNGAMHHMDGELFGVIIPQSLPKQGEYTALAQGDISTYYAAVRHSENNTLRSTFEWTNGSRSLRTAPPMAQTNSVMH